MQPSTRFLPPQLLTLFVCCLFTLTGWNQTTNAATAPTAACTFSFSSYAYSIPAGKTLAQRQLTASTESNNHVSLDVIEVVKVAPGIFNANASGSGVAAAVALRVKANGQQIYEAAMRFDQATQKFVAQPIDLTEPGEQVYLVLFGTGMRYHSGLNAVNLNIGNESVAAGYVGPSSQAGLDQLNALLPTTLAGRGEVTLSLIVDGKTANTVKLAFK